MAVSHLVMGLKRLTCYQENSQPQLYQQSWLILTQTPTPYNNVWLVIHFIIFVPLNNITANVKTLTSNTALGKQVCVSYALLVYNRSCSKTTSAPHLYVFFCKH